MEALQELKKVRDELRLKIHLLGMDAGDVVCEAKAILGFIETRIAAVKQAVRRDAEEALGQVHDRLDALAEGLGQRKVRKSTEAKPAETRH